MGVQNDVEYCTHLAISSWVCRVEIDQVNNYDRKA